MRSLSSLIPVLSTILACGPGDPATTAAPTTSSSGSTSLDSTASGSTTEGDPTAAPTTTDTPNTTTTTGPDITTSTTEPAATTDEATTSTTDPGTTDPGTTDPGTTTDETTTTGEPGDAELRAFYVPGGLDRIVVRKADVTADLCTSVVFVWPMPNQDPDVTLPLDWSVQMAEVNQGAADCLDFQGWLPDAVVADGVAGTASWATPNLCEGTLDIDISLTFPAASPWVPAQDLLQGTDLALQGC